MIHLCNRPFDLLVRPFLLLVICCWFLLGHWLAIPLLGFVALGFLAASLIATAILPADQMMKWWRKILAASWVGSLVFFTSFWLEKQRSHVLDLSYAVLAGLIATAIFIASRCLQEPVRKRFWHGLAATWAFAAASVWLIASYLQNDRVAFHVAILAMLAVLIIYWRTFRHHYLVVVSVRTLVLILVFVPLADLLLRPSYALNSGLDDSRRLYSYEVAKEDPGAFAAWWNYYVDQYHKMIAELGRNSTGTHSSILPPNSHATFFRGSIEINDKGFRGPDFPYEKGDAYRIVALGESTTFGMTIKPADKPWPEVLECIIHERLKSGRPVQVINAGIPAMTLPDNIRRFPTEILPLQPDMIISYHGINGFMLLDQAMPRIHGHKQPAYRSRPLKLLADAEYGIKMAIYRRSFRPKAQPFRSGTINLGETEYASAYRELIHTAQSNHIRLAIANFSMAVNDRSKPDVVTFYRAGFPSVHAQIQANALHSELVTQLVRENPDVRKVDSHPNLDGKHDKFIDLIHFSQEGRDQLAENVFAGIKDILQADLQTNAPAIVPPSPAR